jgi:hypothetical protein
MARTSKKVIEPVVVKSGVGVAEVVVPVTVETDGPTAPKKPRATKRPRKPAAAKPKLPDHDDARELARRFDEATRRLHEFGRVAGEVLDSLESLRRERQEVAREMKDFRREAAAAREELHRATAELKSAATTATELKKAAGAVGDLKAAAAAATELKATAKSATADVKASASAASDLKASSTKANESVRLAGESGQKLLRELKDELAPFTQGLREARPHLVALPGQAASAAAEFDKVARSLPDAARQVREVEDQIRESNLRLADLREQVQASELRLAVVEQQVREGETRLVNARQQLEQAEQQWKEREPAEELEVTRNRLGLTVGTGVVVDEVQPGLSAEVAGLRPGDVLRSVNGAPARSGAAVRRLVRDAVGQQVALSVTRAGEHIGMTARLNGSDSEESEEDRNRLGMILGPGVVVDEVVPGSPAESAGLLPGDIIKSVNGTAIDNGEQLRQLVQLVSTVDDITLEFVRAGKTCEVQVGPPVPMPA